MQWLEIFNHSPAAVTLLTIILCSQLDPTQSDSTLTNCCAELFLKFIDEKWGSLLEMLELMIHHLHDKTRFMLSTLSTILAHAPAQFLHSVCARNYTGLIWMTVVVVVVYAVVNIIINILTPVFILHSLKVQHLKVVKNRIFVKIRIT